MFFTRNAKINGEGKNPTKDNMLAVASKVGFDKRRAKEVMEEVEGVKL